MKKILAILLALMMTASVALVSCDDSSSADADGPADFNGDFVVDDEDEGDGSGEADEDDEGEENKSNTSTTMEAASGNVYVLFTAKIRETPKENGKVLFDNVPFGTELTRTKANSKWTEVTYQGKTGYIMNDIIGSKESSTFVEKKNEDGSAVVTKIKDSLGGANNAIIRKFPLADGVPKDFTILEKDEFDPGSIVGQIPKGTENITVISVSEDNKWAYVEGTGTVFENGASANKTDVIKGYTLYSNLEIAGSATSGSSGDSIG